MKGGRGRKNSPVAVFYPRATRERFFPDGRYLMSVAKSLGIPSDEFYVTPIIKDFDEEKPRNYYLDKLVAEMAIVNPNVSWVVGREALEILTIGEPKKYYRHIFGMHIPILIENFFGLLLPDSNQAAKMPDRLKQSLYQRVSAAVDAIAVFRRDGRQGPQKIDNALRGDSVIIRALMREEGFVFDRSLSKDNSFCYIWSKKVRGPIILTKTNDAKRKWLASGLGLVFTIEEVMELERDEADFLAESVVYFGSRSVTQRKVD